VRGVLFLLIAIVASVAVGGDALRAQPSPPSGGTIGRAQTVRLIMVDDPACGYCKRWHREVGGGYGRTAEGRAAPLQQVSRESKVLRNFAVVVYTPTFILVRDGREVGRITGYPGPFYFWEELASLMSSAGISTKG
jgi:hypothetical protein